MNKMANQFNPFITDSEKTKIIGARAEQIARGAKPLIDVGNLESSLEIAEKEFEEGKTPLIISRQYGKNEKTFKLHELILK